VLCTVCQPQLVPRTEGKNNPGRAVSMDATHGVAAPALSSLGRNIREYSLFQGIKLVLHQLRQAHPHLDEDALYERLEFRANPSMGFPGTDIESVELFHEHG